MLLIGARRRRAGFDVEAATRAYLDTLAGRGAGQVRCLFRRRLLAAPVGRAGRRSPPTGSMLRFGWSAAWSRWAEPGHQRAAGCQPALYALPFTLAGALLALPWTIYTDFIRENQYGLVQPELRRMVQANGASCSALAWSPTPSSSPSSIAVIRSSPEALVAVGHRAPSTALIAVLIMLSPGVHRAACSTNIRRWQAGPLRVGNPARSPMSRASPPTMSTSSMLRSSPSAFRPMSRASDRPSASRSTTICSTGRTSAGIKAVMGHEMGHYKLVPHPEA